MKKLLFIGDVVGKSGCEFLTSKLSSLKHEHGIDITIVNGENSAQGNGITRASADMLIQAGADIITTGNHAFRRKEALELFDEEYMVRPAPEPEGQQRRRGQQDARMDWHGAGQQGERHVCIYQEQNAERRIVYR